MKKFYIFALAAIFFAACATDQTTDVQPVDAPETLTVSFEEDTRIQLNEAQKTVWTEGDLVSVFYKSYDNLKFKFDGKTGDRTGTLSMVNGELGAQTMDHTIVVYPYSADYRVSLDSGGIDAVLPATQHYAKDSYGIGNNLMVAQSEFTNFSLRNTCGWLKLQLTGNGEKVKSITLKGNNNEQVAGLVHINTADAALTLATTVGDVPAEDENGVGGTGGGLVFDNTILTEVTLNCGNGVELGAGATAFYIALPPQMFEKGITVEIADTSGYTMTQSTDKSLTIERNTIQPMATFKFINPNTPTQPTPANNEIWYTATAKVEPYFPDEFGATITSNVWDSESGKGVITFNANVTKIGYYAFSKCEKIKTITIPDSVTEIGDRAFFYCNSLTSITIPDSVTSIGNYTFYDCTSLTSVIIPDSVTEIGEYAFYGCTSLTSVTIGNGVTSIGEKAFCACRSLTSITIPDSVTSIGEEAFSSCSRLTSVTIGNSVTSIGEKAFSSCSSLTAFYGKFASEDNRCLIVNGTLNAFAIGCGATSYTIPDSVTSIGYYAFRECSSLTSVNIPNSVTEIGIYAFYKCSSLTSVTIPDSVTLIGQHAFHECSSLTSVTIGNSVTSIGIEAFRYCSSLKTLYCKPTTPPTISSFQFLSSACKIYVPASDDDSIINAYKTADDWKNYASYFVEYDFSAEQ